MRRELEQKNIAVDLGQLIRELEEIKQLHRLNIPQILPGRYTSIRRKLIEVRGSYSVLSVKQKATLQESISQLAAFENLLDTLDVGQQADLKSSNEAVNREIDKLIELLILLQNKGRRRE